MTAPAQDPADPSEIVNALLSTLLGFGEVTSEQLQHDVAEVGGVGFRSEVRLDYLTREGLAAYLQELLDSEYPPERAEIEERLLLAFDLLPAGTGLRALRARLLQDQVAGFYDERPGRKRLYAVSAERRLTPANQLILAHELRHALQDQYAEIAGLLPADVGDFDDRRLALMSLLEGDATLVMERFLRRRLPEGGEGDGPDLSGLSQQALAIPGAPAILRDQLVQPYLVGRDFAVAVWKQGGWDALKAAWQDPPESTEQVLHPAKFFAREAPVRVEPRYGPPEGRLLDEGVLGELLTRTLLGEEAGVEASAGWGGDRYRVWDVAGRTLLVWRSVWDAPRDAAEFGDALRARYERSHGAARPFEGGTLYGRGRWSVALATDGGSVTLVSSDDAGALVAVLKALR